jgi:DNA polymerase-3 subunit delta
MDSNIDEVITNYRPPIFWKEKDIVKKQIKIWNYAKIQKLIVKVNNMELLVKKHPSLSINIVTDFILNQAIEVNS